MGWLTKVLTSSIGKKFAVALSGLGLVGFLVGHLAGNLNLYLSTAALDQYATDLHHIPGFPLIELGLLAMFLVHIPLVIWLIRSNKSARGSDYAVAASKRSEGKAQSLSSRTMKLSGLFLLLFLVVHVGDFRLERAEFHGPGGSVLGLGHEVVETLQSPLLALVYLIGSLLAGWHVFHGIQSALRSLGLQHDKYTPFLEKAGFALAIVLGLGFASLPIAVQVGLIDEGDAAADTEEADPPADTAPDEHADARPTLTPATI